MKMAEIHILSDEIINKIAAGEVIERPASVVKELIENAIDANATRIQISIEEGGKRKIQVSDNGFGMHKQDLDICYLRHTTSKLFNASDLFHLHTNGFRGEAVASIAAVSKLTITSSTEDGDSNRIVLEGGNVINELKFQANRGTTFLVENLFYNTPVRRTFLSSDTSESTRILEVVLKIAIAHPEIRFDYKVHDKIVFTGVPGDLRSRIAESIGFKIAKALLPVDYTEAGVKVTGFISPTTETNGKRNNQFIFIRNRLIESKMISRAVQQCYAPYGANCKPISVLFLDMPDMEFDVNVHPAKREVRFANSNIVFLVVTHAIRETLTKSLGANSAFIDLSSEPDNVKNLNEKSVEYSAKNNSTNVEFPTTFKAHKVTNDLAQDIFSQPEADKVISLENQFNKKVTEPKWIPPTFFQIANTYIASEDSDGLLVVDQHAAHMRILYEIAKNSLQKGVALDSQELLFPELLDLSKLEIETLHSVENEFKRLGFYIEHFGGETYQIRAIPNTLSLSRTIKTVRDFLDSVNVESNSSTIQDVIAKAWAKANAYIAGDKLKPEEMAALVSQLMLTEEPLTSPYGRPTLLRISLDELSKKFRH